MEWKRSPESEVVAEEAIRLAFLVGALLVVYKWQWFEHQLWRIGEIRNRKKTESRLARQQVQKEISMMEHGQS